MKHQTPDSMKFRKLMRRLGTSRLVTVGTLELLWLSTQKNRPQGDIGRFTDEEIAIECEWEGAPEELVGALVETGWLDPCEVHRLVVHDWEEHAPGWIRRQLKRHGKDFVTASSRPSVTGDALEATARPPSVTGDALEATPNPTQPNPTEGGRKSTAHESTFDAATAAVGEPNDIPPPDPDRAYRFGVSIGKNESRADTVLAWKLTALERVLGEAWFANIKTAVRELHPKKPWAYAWTVAAKGSRELPGPGEERLRRLLAQAPEPPPDWPKAIAEKHKREPQPS